MKLRIAARKLTAFFLVFVLTAAMLPPAFADEPDQADGDVFSMAEELSRETESGGADYDGYIFKVKDSLSHRDSMGLASALEEDTGIEAIEYAPDYYTSESLEEIKAFVDEDCIEFIEPDYIVTLDDVEMQGVTSAAAEDANEEHLNLMKVPSTWDYGFAGGDMDTDIDMGGDGKYEDKIVVAVIDSGLVLNHEDIDYNRVVPGRNFVSASTSSTVDTLGHGSFVTGQISAIRGNDKGIAGIARDVYVMPLKVFASRETATSIIINAIQYATKQRTDFDDTKGEKGENVCVMNMSLGGELPSTAMEESVEAAISAGIIVIVAAGNDEDTRASYPAQYAIGVGSTNSQGVRSYYSQILSKKNGPGYENKVWVSAPGENYTSLWYDRGYYKGSGTSFSAPEVSALAAIAVSIKNDLGKYGGEENNHYAFRQLLKDTSDFKKCPEELIDGQDCYYGWGIVNFENLIEELTGLAENRGKPAAVSFLADNGVGTPLTAEGNNLSITVKKQENEELQTETDGVYNLEIGTKYEYTATADKYKVASGSFIPIKSEKVISFSMEGKDYFVGFDVENTSGEKLETAVVNVFKSEGAKISAGSDGRFAVKNGEYRYIVSAEGFYPVNGRFEVNDGNNEYEDDSLTIKTTMTGAQDVCSVRFAVTGGDSMMDPSEEVSVSDGEGKTVFPQSDGTWKLVPGRYSYLIESDYYKSVSGDLTIEDEDKDTEKVVSETMSHGLYWAFITVKPSFLMSDSNTVITVLDGDGQEVFPANQVQGEYRTVKGAYTYEVCAEGYKTEKGGFTMKGSTLSIDVTMSLNNLDSIKVTKSPAKTAYAVGDTLDLTGLEVVAVYADKNEKPVTGYMVSPADGSELKDTGKQTITITYKESNKAGEDIEKTVSFEVTVKGSGGGNGPTSGGGGGGDDTEKTPDPAAESVTTTTTKSPDGTVITTQTTASGHVSAQVTLPQGVGRTTVTIPTPQRPGAGDVAIIIHPDGTRELVKTSIATENGIQVTLQEGARLEIVNNSKHFDDAPAALWAAEAVDFVSSREIFTGTSEDSFSPNAGMTRAMLMTALYRIDGGTASENAENWYSDALKWSIEKGLSDGSDPTGNITREQLAAILYRHAGSPAAQGSLDSFGDHDQVSSWAGDALSWAVEKGLISGKGDGVLDPGGNATRAEVAAILMRYLSK